MLQTAFKSSALYIMAAIYASDAAAQTMTLISATAPRVNNVLNVGNAATPGYVSGTTFSANFSGYRATVGFTGGSGIVKGANPSWNVSGINGTASAPTIGGAVVASNYLVASSGTVMLTLNRNTTRFQFLWGSPGFGDIITLFNGTTQVAQFTGAQVNSASPAFTNAPGTTVIANLRTTGGITFNRVAITNPTSTFEFAPQTTRATAPTVAGGAVIVASLPSPAPFPMLGATLLGNMAALFGMFVMWKRRLKLKQNQVYA